MPDTSPAAGAPTVLLVHGAFADGSSWTPVIKMLQEAKVQVRALATHYAALSLTRTTSLAQSTKSTARCSRLATPTVAR